MRWPLNKGGVSVRAVDQVYIISSVIDLPRTPKVQDSDVSCSGNSQRGDEGVEKWKVHWNRSSWGNSSS